jgi:phosphoribosylanthranilate isomerase
MRVKIKICGVTNVADATTAIEAGADALGFMFYDASPRHVTLVQAASIIRQIPPFVAKVGVFVNATEETVRHAITACGLDTLQFHGDETPEFCRKFAPFKVARAFRIKDAASLAQLNKYDTDAWLLDSYVPGKLGGTGAKFTWSLACEAKESGRPIILAGGLTPENVAEAIHEVWPYAVDVSSGVESAPGKKDHAMIRDFIAAVRGIESEKY